MQEIPSVLTGWEEYILFVLLQGSSTGVVDRLVGNKFARKEVEVFRNVEGQRRSWMCGGFRGRQGEEKIGGSFKGAQKERREVAFIKGEMCLVT
jgi:hypothetical protein